MNRNLFTVIFILGVASSLVLGCYSGYWLGVGSVKPQYVEVTKYFPVDTGAILKPQLRNLLAFRETRFAKNAYQIQGNGFYGRYQCSWAFIQQFNEVAWNYPEINYQNFINSPASQDTAIIKSFDYYLTQYRPPNDWLLAYWYACHTSGYVYAGKEFRLNGRGYIWK